MMPITRKGLLVPAALAAATLAVTACGTPGAAPPHNGAAARAVSTSIGAAPVTLKITTDSTSSGGELTALGKLFHREHPQVTVDITQEKFTTLQQNGPLLISGANAPDLIHYPTLGNAVKDGLLTNLDPYAAAYGWDSYPQSQFTQMKVAGDGVTRGSGSLYEVGIGYTVTGIFYNKHLAARIGMSSPPATLAAFEQMLAAAKAHGMTALMIDAKDGGAAFPLQLLEMDYGGYQAVTNWCLDKPGADINTPQTVRAAATVRQWAADGYFPADANSLDTTAAAAAFIAGKGVFMSSGNWLAGAFDKAMPGNVGFFLFPPLHPGGPHAAMSDPAEYAIPAKAAHKNLAAAFLNFIQTDAQARQTIVDTSGIAVGGPAGISPPTAPPGSVTRQTLAAFAQLSGENGIAPYMANATSGIYTETLIPQTQLLIAGKVTPAAFASTLQASYQTGLGR